MPRSALFEAMLGVTRQQAARLLRDDREEDCPICGSEMDDDRRCTTPAKDQGDILWLD